MLLTDYDRMISILAMKERNISIWKFNERKEISQLFSQLSKIDKFNIGMSDHLEIYVF